MSIIQTVQSALDLVKDKDPSIGFVGKSNRANAVLFIEGFSARNVHKYDYEFSQSVDKQNNQPVGAPIGGRLKITMEAKQDNDFLHWMANKPMVKDGKLIVYMASDPDQTWRELKFKNARIVLYKETWTDPKRSSNEETAHVEYIEIVWGSLYVGGVLYDNNWGWESDIFSSLGL